ncbi:MAG TPA: hypothetical protein PKY30_04765 [Myxococcota bacterium]|jgi:hypothetical protein|nr:hypothetical protein [Myxococcota bacterium]HND28522.1 hypothetical protein [Myxococcota bacterium]HNH46322.1 hypothetical protein [Myxococcota bacterium]
MRNLLLLSVLVLGGCNLKYWTVPGAPLPFASVNYSVMGSTSAEACGTYIFAIDWGHLFTDQQGSIGGGGAADPLSAILGMLPIGGPSPEAARALYDAIEKMPEATNIYAPKVHEHVTGFSPFGTPVFGKRCATVEAHGVKLGTGPVPNAN